ncbi:hypothetical protein DL98DRAFT_293252 [Cadophora sp. DSE1049]|nr:hypothetical protein DL98DRAFT_293252 [Cadophora sp. DSE1049]
MRWGRYLVRPGFIDRRSQRVTACVDHCYPLDSVLGLHTRLLKLLTFLQVLLCGLNRVKAPIWKRNHLCVF